MKFYFLLIIWTAASVSCQKKELVSKKYFDVDSLIDCQLVYLNKVGASITKFASVDSANDKSTFKPDSASWINELAVFRHLELINKPIYADAYDELNGIKDENSNLTIRIFSSQKEVPVKHLKIYYQGFPQNVRKVEAVISEQNTLYYTARKFSMEFDDNGDQVILSQYSVLGVQKMILRDSVRFSISSKINY